MTEALGSPQVYRFGVFEFDPAAGEVRKQGMRIKLQGQPIEILAMLLARSGQLISREEIQKKLWPDGTIVEFEHSLNAAVRRLRDALDDSAETPRYIETLARRGYRFIGSLAANPGRIESIAVLPLENLSRDPEQEYFADGLTEALITTLARIGELRVASRTSAMQYKGVRKSLREIARELQVDGVIEGTVQRSGERLRISAQLLHAHTDRHLWAESYDRDLRDVLALQSEIAQAIAREVQVKLTPQEKAHLAQVQLVDPEAYEAYLKGRYHWNKRPAELGKATQYFKLAVTKDPTYAAAYAGLADCFSGLTAWGLVPANEGSVKARGLAQKAVELDRSSAEAHASLAFATMYHYDFLAAERGFERAIELSPRYTLARHLFGYYLAITGRHEEAYAEYRRAMRLDPLSSIINATCGLAHIYARRYDQAIEQCVKTLELDPSSGMAQGGLGWAYRCKSMYELAIPAVQKACELWPGTTPIAWLGEMYAAGGYRDEAHKILERLNQLSKQQYVTPYGVGRIYAALGEKDQAFHWLETAYQQRADWMVLLKVDPCFDELRADARFQALFCRMNFPL